jgi:MraZ protein
MALTGTFPRSLDEKLRVAIPKRLCDEFGEGDVRELYVAPGQDKCLVVYAPSAFERLGRKIARQSSTRMDVRTYRRLFFARAERVELDAQGRVRLPDRLVEFAGLRKDVVLAGVQDHLEIWDADHWQSYLNQYSAAFDDVAAQALESRELEAGT